MKLVFSIDPSKLSRVKHILEQDPIGRSSIYYKSSESLNMKTEELYVIIDGSEENCELAKEELEEIGTLLEEEEREEVIKKFEESENAAMEGFGGLFS